MAGKINANIRKSVKNRYNSESGLPIMINLYVIKYIYYHIKKADRFLEKNDYGKKPKAVPIYQNELPMSRQRFDRINKGINFEITSGEADFITKQFGIDMKYFRRENPIAFEIDGISLTDWKCFYKTRYEVRYKLTSTYRKEYILSRAEEIERVLKKLVGKDWESRLGKNDPLYAVFYYFHYGKRFDAPSSIDVLRESLKSVDCKDWERESIGSLKENYCLLEKHCNYVKALITIEELQK